MFSANNRGASHTTMSQATGPRSSRRQQGLEPLGGDDLHLLASPRPRSDGGGAGSTSSTAAAAAARANASALRAAARAAATAADAADAEADDAEERASQRVSPAASRRLLIRSLSPPPSPHPRGSQRAELRRSARIAAARAARGAADSDDEEQESVNGSAAASSTRGGDLDFITEVLRIDGDEDDVYQPDKQITVKEAAGVPSLYGAKGAGQNREFEVADTATTYGMRDANSEQEERAFIRRCAHDRINNGSNRGPAKKSPSGMPDFIINALLISGESEDDIYNFIKQPPGRRQPAPSSQVIASHQGGA